MAGRKNANIVDHIWRDCLRHGGEPRQINLMLVLSISNLFFLDFTEPTLDASARVSKTTTSFSIIFNRLSLIFDFKAPQTDVNTEHFAPNDSRVVSMFNGLSLIPLIFCARFAIKKCDRRGSPCKAFGAERHGTTMSLRSY